MINHLPYGSDNIDLKKTGSFPNSQEANFFKSLYYAEFVGGTPSLEQLNRG